MNPVLGGWFRLDAKPILAMLHLPGFLLVFPSRSIKNWAATGPFPSKTRFCHKLKGGTPSTVVGEHFYPHHEDVLQRVLHVINFQFQLHFCWLYCLCVSVHV